MPDLAQRSGWIESVQPKCCANPQNAIPVLDYVEDFGIRYGMKLPGWQFQPGKVITIEPVQTIVRSDPDETFAVFNDPVYFVGRQTIRSGIISCYPIVLLSMKNKIDRCQKVQDYEA
jgi:hypothetical protein